MVFFVLVDIWRANKRSDQHSFPHALQGQFSSHSWDKGNSQSRPSGSWSMYVCKCCPALYWRVPPRNLSLNPLPEALGQFLFIALAFQLLSVKRLQWISIAFNVTFSVATLLERALYHSSNFLCVEMPDHTTCGMLRSGWISLGRVHSKQLHPDNWMFSVVIVV